MEIGETLVTFPPQLGGSRNFGTGLSLRGWVGASIVGMGDRDWWRYVGTGARRPCRRESGKTRPLLPTSPTVAGLACACTMR